VEDTQYIVVEDDSQPAVEIEVATSPSPSPADSTPAPNSEGTSSFKASTTADLPSTPASLNAFVVTIKLYYAEPVETVEVDAFLLPALPAPDVEATKPAMQNHEVDAGDDWFEVEA
jgi:hypothetical protein